MSKQYFSVKNFEQLQHYKDRNPPWIKLYNSLLDDYEFSCLQDASKLHLICIWLLASRTSNKVPWDSGWIQKKIGVSQKVNLEELEQAGFIKKISSYDDCSNMLAGCYQDAIPEGEGETEKNISSNGVPFDEFWNVYPRKEAKKKAEQSWNRLPKRKQEKAVSDCQIRYRDTADKKFIPLPTTYINGERWEDESPEESKPRGFVA